VSAQQHVTLSSPDEFRSLFGTTLKYTALLFTRLKRTTAGRDLLLLLLHRTAERDSPRALAIQGVTHWRSKLRPVGLHPQIIRAQDSSSFILVHEHSKVFKKIFIQIARETPVRESDCPGNVLYPLKTTT